ncbi:hypothetical protein [Marinomonas atlantica]|uniref:hypothetical protein n=1 Tax=Marinomonas atlantica TaxID=1806668 RepID=UPI00082AD92C|nr:hypothetical protein [Marinomonas atlantica]
MKVNVFQGLPVDVSNSGEWLFIRSAVGDMDVTFYSADGGPIKTVTLGQGEKLELSFSRIQIQSRSGDQLIDIRIGWGKYTPNMTAITSTLIQSIVQPVRISGIDSAIAIANPVTVSSITDPVVVSSITDPVVIQSISDPVVIESVTNPVTVSSITAPVVVAGIASTVDVEVVTPVEVVDMTGTAFLSTDYTIPANDYIDIPARDRSQIIFQNMSESTTKCRVSDTAETEAVGMWVIGGGSLFGESPILRTKSALRIWNTSSSDAVVTVTEVY